MTWTEILEHASDVLAIEHAARRPEYQPLGARVAAELWAARQHLLRAAKLSGVDVGELAGQGVGGGVDLRPVVERRATHDSQGRRIVNETRPGDGCGLSDDECNASTCDWCRQ